MINLQQKLYMHHMVANKLKIDSESMGLSGSLAMTEALLLDQPRRGRSATLAGVRSSRFVLNSYAGCACVCGTSGSLKRTASACRHMGFLCAL